MWNYYWYNFRHRGGFSIENKMHKVIEENNFKSFDKENKKKMTEKVKKKSFIY